MIEEELVIGYFKQWKTDLVVMMREQNKYLDVSGISRLFDNMIKTIERISI